MLNLTMHVSTRLRRLLTPRAERIAFTSRLPDVRAATARSAAAWARLDRFLAHGAEGGTSWAAVPSHPATRTATLARCVAACAREDGARAIARVLAAQARGAPVEPTLYVLAAAAATGDGGTRVRALATLDTVARTSTHLEHFLQYLQTFHRADEAHR